MSPARATSPRRAAATLLAVDVGTSGARAAVFDLMGRRLVEVRRAYPTYAPRPGWAEQDARAWRSASLAALAEAIRRAPAPPLAIGLTGQCPSVVGVDARGRPTGPGLLYRDNRATGEAAEFRRRFGAAEVHRVTGHLPAAFHVGPKLLWLRRHQPDRFAATRTYLQPRDLVGLALTGDWATDGTHAAATLLYALEARSWHAPYLEALGLSAGLLPPLRASSSILGELRPRLVRRFKLPAAIPVVMGGADSQACALGCGLVDPGPASEMAGSSTCLNTVVTAPLPALEVTHYPHVVGNHLTTETGLNTTGAAVAWLARLLYRPRGGRTPGSRAYERLDAAAASAGPGADGLLMLPVLGDGERTDAALRGALVGLSERHDDRHLARALLEGVAYEMRAQLDLLRAAGVPVEELRVSGGDTRLATWNQVKADVIGVPVRVVEGDAAVTGVAMLAGLGCGAYADAAAAVAAATRLGRTWLPDPAARGVHETRYPAW
ncbi:MAG TPA: FGGY family carbohydrate kinase, partial [Candidatus Sulfotelmatobacter sp.]|nr:FGGY family carbohydrate kinase [Candidatus Sulfotelmatobacter sp.]